MEGNGKEGGMESKCVLVGGRRRERGGKENLARVENDLSLALLIACKRLETIMNSCMTTSDRGPLEME
jgi:hypothetical protein